MGAIHRIFTGDEVRAAGLIPVADTQMRSMQAEMDRAGITIMHRRFEISEGFIDVSINNLTTNIHIHQEEGGGFYYDFVATDHVTNEGSVAYSPELYNGGGIIVQIDGIWLRLIDGAYTTLDVHGVEVKFDDNEVRDVDKFPLRNPTGAPRYGKKISPRSVTGKCSSTGLNGAPTQAHERYPLGTNILTRMPLPYIWNVQAAPQYRWYTGNDKMVVSGLKISSANTMSWTQEAMGDFPSRKHAACAIDVGSDISTQYFRAENDTGAWIDRDSLDFEMSHSCVRTVNGVEFWILTDVKGDVYLSPTADPAANPRILKIQPPYPDWVSAYSYNARWTWDFNSDATKMVAVPYHSDKSDAISVEDHEWMEDPPSGIPPTCGDDFEIPPEYYTIEDTEYFTSLYYFYNGHNGYIRKNTPGFVEFDINITVVDGELTEAKLILARNDWYGDSGVFYNGAAYEYNTDALILQTVEAYASEDLNETTFPVPEDGTSGGYMATKYTDISDDEHFQWTSTSGSYDLLPTIDVIWKMLRKTYGPNNEEITTTVATETLVRNFPLAREHHVFSGLPDKPCNDQFSSKLFDIYLLANTGSYGQTFFNYIQVIEAVDMKSGTYAIRYMDYYKKGYRIMSNGHKLKEGGDIVEIMDPPSLTFPVLHPEILGYWAAIHIKSDFFNFIDSHPDGHMAMCIPDYYQADAPIEAWWDNVTNEAIEPPNEMIDYIRLADGSEGTHKDLFNKAFKQNRDYQFYYDPMYLGQYLTKSTHEDRGSFAVSGIWRKF